MNYDAKTLARFWSKVDKRGPDECWPWLGATRKGYGYLKVTGKKIGSHRIAWTLLHGPIPEGQSVLHQCDNPPCVNPNHLFKGDLSDNAVDAFQKGRRLAPGLSGNHVRGERSPMAYLTTQNVLWAREQWSRRSLTQRQIADRLGCGLSAVKMLIQRRSWKHVP